ncbi:MULTISPECIES: hypothetical protein [Streptomyces]|uniref:hypothetical protein n=1 Tax=Streptomyces TaxID=1883 RepID=UPI00131A5919|nr:MULTISPECIES: hypothetical protein [Streptomyces]
MEFIAPAGFTEIPIGMTSEEAREELISRVSREALEARPVAYENLVSNLQKVSQALEDSGTLYAGTCLRAYEGELSLGTLLVTVTPFAFGDAAVAADGMVRSLIAARGDAWAGTVLDTPVGPAAVLTGVNGFVIPAETSESGEELNLPMAEMQVYLPVPEGVESQEQCLVSFNFTTPCEGHWDAYCSDIVALLNSVTFDEPDHTLPEGGPQPTSPSSPVPSPPAQPLPGASHAEGKTPATPFG